MKKLSVTLLLAMLMIAIAMTASAAVSIMIGYENNPGEPIDLACQEWKRLVEEKSNGDMIVDLYPSSQLGSKDNIIDQAMAGDCVITLANGAFFQDRGVKDFGVVFAPYLFENWEQIDKLAASDWFAQKKAELSDVGLTMLTGWHYGARDTMTIKPVATVADIKGMKIRVPNNTLQVKGMAAIGAVPTPMALGEVYTALQQGTIDGLENPLPVLLNGAYQEVAKYLILDHHILDYTCWVCGTEFFNTLTPEQQQILVEAGEEAGVYNNSILEETTAKALEDLKAAGVTVVDFDRESFAAAAESFYEDADIKAMWSEGLIDTIREIIK